MEKLKIKVVNTGKQQLPQYATTMSAGMDLRADIENDVILSPGKIALIPTGLHIQLPDGYEAMVRPRSGLAFKHGITVLNTPGCVDGDYTGDVGVILINHSQKPFNIAPGERIAQLVISPIMQCMWEEVDELETTERGDGGFGHSGIK